MWVQSVCLCRFDQRVQVRVGSHAPYRLREEIILATDNEGPDRVLRAIVVDRITAIFNIALQVHPLIGEISERLTQRGLWRRSRLSFL